jgi:hypothetical protein
VDIRSGSILSDKVIYSNPGDHQLDLLPGRDPKGDFHYLLVRNTAATSGFMHPVSEYNNDKVQITTGLSALYLSDQLQPTLKDLSSSANGGAFLCSLTDARGQLTVISFEKEQLIVERFGPDGQFQKKMTSPLEYRPDGFKWNRKEWLGQLDPDNGNIVAFSIAQQLRHAYLNTFVFDFATGQIAFQQKDELNKDYFRSLKDNAEMTRAKHFKLVEKLEPDNILFTKDRLITFNEIRYDRLFAQNSGGCEDAEGIVVSIYDRQQYHLLDQLLLDRYQESKINTGRGLSYTIRDGKIHAFGCENTSTWPYEYANFYFVIDPEKNVAERKTPDWGTVQQSDPVDTQHILWFRNGIVRPTKGAGFLVDSDIHTYLAKLNY